MAEVNLFLNASRFSKIIENPDSLAIFLSIASHKRRTYAQLMEDTKLNSLAQVATLTETLEKGKFIEKNPNPLSNRFKLAFNGQLFAEQLKVLYPEVEKLLGPQNLIKPIKISKKQIQSSLLSTNF